MPTAWNNNGEAASRVELNQDYTRGEITRQIRSERFHTPTAITRAPDDTLLITNAELFDLSEPLAPDFIASTPRF